MRRKMPFNREALREKQREKQERLKEIEDNYKELVTQRANIEAPQGEIEIEIDKLEKKIRDKKCMMIELKEQAIEEELNIYSINE